MFTRETLPSPDEISTIQAEGVVPLFSDDDSDEPLVDTMDATQKIALIRRLEGTLERIERQDRESRQFYAMLMARTEERIANVKALLLVFLQHEGISNLKTPLGTAQQRNLTVRNWPEAGQLVSWAQKHCPAGVRTKYEPDKRAITEHIQRTGETPEGYTETPEVRLYVI